MTEITELNISSSVDREDIFMIGKREPVDFRIREKRQEAEIEIRSDSEEEVQSILDLARRGTIKISTMIGRNNDNIPVNYDIIGCVQECQCDREIGNIEADCQHFIRLNIDVQELIINHG